MDEEDRKSLLRDYEEADKVIRELLKKGRPNFSVKSQHYLNPTIYSLFCSLSDKDGELKYYVHVRNCIEDVLINEKTKLSVSNAPDYLSKFFNKS